MFCPKCGSQNPDNSTFCANCGSPIGGNTNYTGVNTNNQPYLQPQPPKKKSKAGMIIGIVVGVLVFLFILGSLSNHKNKKNPKEASVSIDSSEIEASSHTNDSNSNSTTKATSKTTTNSSENPDTENSEDTYEHNQYYDIVETSTFKNSIGNTIIVHKVHAKQNVSISATMIATGDDNKVIGKSDDNITLTDGQYNYFRYQFDGDISNASLKTTFQKKSDSFLTEERSAVEMTDYNRSEDYLYITFKQKVDKLNSFAKFKLLFYKNNQIVDTEDGYFSIYAQNLNGNGTTDVADIWVYGVDYDRFEYIFEP